MSKKSADLENKTPSGVKERQPNVTEARKSAAEKARAATAAETKKLGEEVAEIKKLQDVAKEMPLEFAMFDEAFEKYRDDFDKPAPWSDDGPERAQYQNKMTTLRNFLKVGILKTVESVPAADRKSVFEAKFDEVLDFLNKLDYLTVPNGKISPEDLRVVKNLQPKTSEQRNFIDSLRSQENIFKAETKEDRKFYVKDYLTKRAESAFLAATTPEEKEAVAEKFLAESERMFYLMVGSKKINPEDFREIWNSISTKEVRSLLDEAQDNPIQEIFDADNEDILEQARDGYRDMIDEKNANLLSGTCNPNNIGILEGGSLSNILLYATPGRDMLVYGMLITLATNGFGAFTDPVFLTEAGLLAGVIAYQKPELVEKLFPKEAEPEEKEHVEKMIQKTKNTSTGEWLSEIDSESLGSEKFEKLLDSKLTRQKGREITSAELSTALSLNRKHEAALPEVKFGDPAARELFDILLACRRNNIDPRETLQQND